MMKIGCAVCAVSLYSMLCGCVIDTATFQDAPDYADYNPRFTGIEYTPGYTGYTMGYDGYGSYDDGYGPSFWNPRFNFYKDGLHGYRKYPYPQ